MRNSFKNKLSALIFSALLPLAAGAADGLPGATVTPEAKAAGPTAEQRTARMEQKCKEDPVRCKEMKEKMEKRRAECKANPQKCHADNKAQAEQRFKRADADGNGTISRAEAQQRSPRLARNFDRFDANKDSQLTREEMAAARKAFFERRKSRSETTKI